MPGTPKELKHTLPPRESLSKKYWSFLVVLVLIASGVYILLSSGQNYISYDQAPSDSDMVEKDGVSPTISIKDVIEGEVLEVTNDTLVVIIERDTGKRETIVNEGKVLIGPKYNEKKSPESGTIFTPSELQEYNDFSPINVGEFVIVHLDQEKTDRYVAKSVVVL
jgi:hypothetical protein